MASSLGDKMLIEDINAMIEEHTELGSIHKGKWSGITDSQVVLLNASPVPLTYSMVVTLLQAHSDPFTIEYPQVENTQVENTQISPPDVGQFSGMNPQDLPFNRMQNPRLMNEKIISLEEKVDAMLAIITELSATLQADQPPAEQ
jgi:hypothetical protein